VRFPLRLRVPSWATRGGSAKLNGRPLEGFAAPGGYFVLDRIWQTGETVELTLPLSLHAQPMPDDDSLVALLYGPLVLAGRLGTAGLTPATLRAEPSKPRTVPEYKAEPVPAPALHGRPDNLEDWIKPVPGKTLEFRTVGQAQEITLVPLSTVFDERYAVYWRVGKE
jgi:DUF1680 family protein